MSITTNDSLRQARMEAIADRQRSEMPDVQRVALNLAIEAQDEETAAALARSIRNRLLKDSDAEVALDRLGLVAPSGSTFTAWLGFLKALGEALIGEWAQYRQALRNLPEQDGFPFSIVWPSAPGREAADAEAEEFAP